MVKIDFADVKELTALEEGDYDATMTAAELVQKAGKDPYVKLEFTCSGDDAEGRKLFRNCSLGAASLWNFKSTMIALGADPEAFDGDVDPEEMAKDLVGAECVLVVGQKMYNDRLTNEVKKVMAPGSFN